MSISPQSSSHSVAAYPLRTILRAERAVRCAPFRLQTYEAMVHSSVSLQALSGKAGVERGYTKWVITELMADVELMWMIEVGLLRREVDGQGLTDSFRVTPLGRVLLDRWRSAGRIELRASWRDRLYNAITRWIRLPF
jgi:hypothetical protein